MEKIERQNEEGQAAMNTFREEIAEIEAKEKLTGKTAHFSNVANFDPGSLTVDDLEIWQKTQAGTVTEEEFGAYRKKFKKTGEEINNSRSGFLSLVGNRAAAVMGQRWLRKKWKKK